MTILRNLSRLHSDIKRNVLPEVAEELQKANSIKSFSVAVLNAGHKVMSKIIVFYPKTVLIAFIANAILTILAASLQGYIGFLINCYFFYHYGDLIFLAIKVHEEKFRRVCQ